MVVCVCVCVSVQVWSTDHVTRFQGFIELFAPGGLDSEVTFAHDIPYEQVHEFY